MVHVLAYYNKQKQQLLSKHETAGANAACG